MSYDFEIRINGVIKMANQITDIPSFFFDGKTVTIVAEMTEEPPELDVPRLNQQEIQEALDAEGASPEGADQGAEPAQPVQPGDEPQRRGGRRRDGRPGEASNEEIAAAREDRTRRDASGASDAGARV